MKAINPLNNRIELDVEESLVSYIYRLSIANHFEFPSVIGDIIGVRWWELESNNFDERVCKTLAVLSRADYQDIYTKSYHSIFKKLNEMERKIWTNGSRIKYCPKCIAEKKMHKSLWGLRPVSVCIKHRNILRHICPKCNRNVQFGSLIKSVCRHCSYKLDQSQTEFVNQSSFLLTAQRDFQDFLLGANNNVFGKLSKFQVISIMDATCRLFDGLESLIKDEGYNKEQKIFTYPPDEFLYTVAFANAYWILFKNFPKNFHYALETFEQSDSPRKKYRKKQFINFLSTHCEFANVKKAYEDFKEMKVIEGQVPRNLETFDLDSALKRKKHYFTKRDILKLYDISKGEIDKLCESDILKPKKIFAKTHTNYFFEKKETEIVIRRFLEEKSDLMTKKETGEILDVSWKGLTFLIKSGHLKQKAGPVEKQFVYISKKSVESFISRMNQTVFSSKENQHSGLISFQACFDKYVTSGLQIGKLLDWIISKQINCYSFTEDLAINQLLIEEEELRNQLKKRAVEEKGYTQKDVSKILGYTERTLHKVIGANLITPKVIVNKQGRKIYYFKKHQVDEFKEVYISPGEAVRRYEVNYSFLNKLWHKKALKNYLDGVCRKTLFKREELEEVLLRKGVISKSLT
ncbi:TniQ protein [Cytobacillus oceanisediminis]|uniref:TniQ protein n=1 Tax=Cytobacillus oceanisediminis TaxID=665099 RepID=A0A2V2ZSH0_9BACI|nr:TniQ family protein [Cytobacillus oceanisediminis]PWW26620.1 TniQ protein [Cytobacillus oceanisediminis]